ncbi:MAG: MetQ/NlpA family ABC transporter substrate-binding protein [Treponema sp.]
MKKNYFAAAAIAAILVTAAGCRKTRAEGTLVVGATSVPHAEFLNLIKDDLAQDGVKLEIREFTDYVTLNDAVESGELDANYYQHIPYMESTNAEKGYHLVNAGGIHIEPFALYSKKYKTLADLPDGASVAIPNDPTNGGRALLLIQSAGLIELTDGGSVLSTPLDVVKNEKNLRFKEIEAASLPRVLADVDAAAINGNYAIPAGLSVTQDSLFIEGSDSPYVNIVAVKEGNAENDAVKALVNALQSQKIRDYIEEKYPNGEVIAAF